MVIQEVTQGAEARDARIRELTEENELLLKQLHVVQEELERYYNAYKRLNKKKQRSDGSSEVDGAIAVIPSQVGEALEENLKLRALVAQQQAALRIESTNSLTARLGDILIKGVSSAGSFIALPIKLHRLWKALEQSTPPAALGGKSFQKVLDTYASGGMEAVEKLLDSIFLSPAMRANAYTALARQVMLTDARQAAELARKAWETDPRPYRLKWLAFRLHEAGDVVTAEALLDMLPADISMSESEGRQAARLRQEAKHERTRQTQKILKASQSNATQTNKQNEGHRQELAHLSKQLEEQQKAANQAWQEAARAREMQSVLQRQMEAQKKESDALALQTALMLKNMLTHFEPDTAVLSRMMRVIMGATASK